MCRLLRKWERCPEPHGQGEAREAVWARQLGPWAAATCGAHSRRGGEALTGFSWGAVTDPLRVLEHS